MTQPWTFSGDPPFDRRSSGKSVTLIDGTTFTISDDSGDISADAIQGLFVRDTRMVSRWELALNAKPVSTLTVQRTSPHSAIFLGRVPPKDGLADSPVTVVRRRYVGNGQREDISLRNSSPHPYACVLTLSVECDFADLFEVKDGRAPIAGPNSPHVIDTSERSSFRLTRQRGYRQFATIVRADRDARPTDFGLEWEVVVPAQGEWTTSVEATAEFDGQMLELRHPRDESTEAAAPARDLQAWRSRGPRLRTRDRDLGESVRRSWEDLGTLRVFHPDQPERPVVAAGAPWFMALFGRDSLLTAHMLLPFHTGMAIGTLQTLAEHQGTTTDADSEEEPGKILHEMRFGPAVKLNLGGRNVYYGTSDATPLFVVLLGAVLRWHGLDDDVRALIPHADNALSWIRHHGDSDGDGFVEYARKTERGLINQGWKDSWDGITFADGTIAEAPIALAEVQGYVYAAYLARAELAEAVGDAATAAEYRTKAAVLKERFNETFWLADKGWFAVGLDRDKRPIDSLTSNIGHCLWSGIVDDDKARSVADHLLSDAMFSGWGIRTLASSMAAYNPLSYHNGSVWPHDNALCAAGLMRYGFIEEAHAVVEAVLTASRYYGHRLPELFAGFAREDFPAPVPYPTACSPQAWAAATPLELLSTMLRLAPDQPAGHFGCAPEVPDQYLPLHLENVRLGPHPIAIELTREGCTVTAPAISNLTTEAMPRAAAQPV